MPKRDESLSNTINSENLKHRLVWVCQHTSCNNNGSKAVLQAFQTADLPEGVAVEAVGCQGQCSSGPTVRILPEETWYCRIKPADVSLIVTQHLQGGKRVEAKLNPRIHLSFNF